MTMRIEVTIEVMSDFHIGTGSGVGRTVDAIVLKDEKGLPYIPASSLKGLARWHAEQLANLHPQLDQAPLSDETDPFLKPTEELFGSAGKSAGRGFFTNARYNDKKNREIHHPQVHGRSSRDRISGRSLKKHLFQFEDAPRGHFQAYIYSDDNISWQATLLLLMALRRIESLGGQRYRGKGQARVSCQVIEGDNRLPKIKLPDHRFEATLKKLVHGELEAVQERSPTMTSAESLRPGASVPQQINGQVLLVFARAQSPLTLTDDPERGNIIGSLDFVPGTSLRGALAWRLIRQGWAVDQEPFQSVFVREQICFGPLYPSQEWKDKASFPFPLPRSLLTCKHAPGMWGDKPHARIHGVRDLLQGGILETCGYSDTDGPCNAPLIPNEGYAQIVDSSTGFRLQPVQLERLSIQRTAIDDEKLRGEDQKLYTTEAIPAGSWFAGYIWGPTDLLAALLQACPIQEEPILLHVGKSRTRGHGELQVFFRLPDGNRHMAYPLLLPLNHTVAVDSSMSAGFTLTLYSDTIGVDKWLRPITRLDGDILWSLLGGIGTSPLKIVRGYMKTRQIAGFNSVPGMPRAPDLALIAGSTWHVSWCSEATATERADTAKRLQQAVSNGIGLRRGEGFGRVIVNLPLHQIDLNQPRASKRQLDIVTDLGFPRPLVRVRDASVTRYYHPPVKPRLDKLPLTSVGSESRIGLARLLWQISQSLDMQKKLEKVVQERCERIQHGKETGGEDTLLQKLAEQCKGNRDPETVQKLIQQCVTELVRLDAEERRKGG